MRGLSEGEIGDLLQDWQTEAQFAGRTDRYIHHVTRTIVALSGTGLGQRALRAYFADRAKFVAPSTLAVEHAYLRAFWRFLMDEGAVNEPLRLKIKTPDPPPVPAIDPDDVRTMIRTAPNPRDRSVLATLFDTGVRRHELVALDLADVDMTTGVVDIRHGKGGRRRQTMLGVTGRTYLRRYLRQVRGREEGPLYLSQRGAKRLGTAGVYDICKAAGERVGIRLRPHDCRHHVAMALKDAGVSDQSIMAVLGWSTQESLARYGRAGQTERALDAMAANSPLDR